MKLVDQKFFMRVHIKESKSFRPCSSSKFIFTDIPFTWGLHEDRGETL